MKGKPLPSVYKNISEVHIEITNMCNLSCTYCYAETLLPNKTYTNSLFTNELYRKTVTKLLVETNNDFLDIVFHGGEPLLNSPEWFEEACSFAIQKAEELGKKVYFTMQSNVTILRHAHVEVFKKYKVLVGVSLDGDKKTHNEMRGKFEITAKNIKKLQEAGLFSGVIVVISHHNWDRVPILFKQLDKMEINIFHLNIASTVGRGDPMEPLGTDKTFRAFKDCLDQMLLYKGKIVDTRLVRKLSQFITPPESVEETLQQLRCDNMFCHAGVTMVSVKNDGDVFPCGCAGSSGNMKKFKLDNMAKEDKVDPSSYFDLLKMFHAKKEKYYTECVKCPAKFVCEHGCPAFDHTDPVTPENTCQATKKLYQYLLSLDKSLLSKLVNDHESRTLPLAQ
ncbi:MAG: radical SAM protein [Bacteroidetes bacterium]|nr:radical SAM protein [Bacteroidota bacterium]